jgi:hypothetical protein
MAPSPILKAFHTDDAAFRTIIAVTGPGGAAKDIPRRVPINPSNRRFNAIDILQSIKLDPITWVASKIFLLSNLMCNKAVEDI